MFGDCNIVFTLRKGIFIEPIVYELCNDYIMLL
jgi:hypothetical protein